MLTRHSMTAWIGDMQVSLQSDAPAILRDFASLYPSALMPQRTDSFAAAANGITGQRECASDLVIEVRRDAQSSALRPRYQVISGGKPVGTPQSRRAVLPFVEWAINLHVIAARSDWLQFHAASLVHRNKGVIFAGDSGCGKSTLAAVLVAHGWQYLCDEFALLSPDTLRLHAFPKALCIKAGALPQVRKLGLRCARKSYVKAYKGKVGYIPTSSLPEGRVARSGQLDLIIFPSYAARRQPRLHEVSNADAVTMLYRCCFNRPSFESQALPLIIDIVRRVRTYRLEVGAPEATARLLTALAGNCPPIMKEIPPIQHAPTLPTVQSALHPQRSAGSVRAALTSRREMLKVGARLAYVAPSILTLTAQQALAATSNPSGQCSTGVHTGGLCQSDSDCCTGRCTLGVCQSPQ